MFPCALVKATAAVLDAMERTGPEVANPRREGASEAQSIGGGDAPPPAREPVGVGD